MNDTELIKSILSGDGDAKSEKAIVDLREALNPIKPRSARARRFQEILGTNTQLRSRAQQFLAYRDAKTRARRAEVGSKASKFENARAMRDQIEAAEKGKYRREPVDKGKPRSKTDLMNAIRAAGERAKERADAAKRKTSPKPPHRRRPGH